ncbi:MAG: nucleoside deaminase [Cyanophyceae cyanobacterium]
MHEPFIQKSIELSRQAVYKSNMPFGACLVRDGKIILTAENTVNTDNDPTGHAETNLVRKAARLFPPDVLQESILYTSTEPCAMCAGAIYWAGIPTVIFGCSNHTLGEIAGPAISLSCREVFARGARNTEVIGPVQEEEAVKVHQDFWNENNRL